MVSSGSSVGTPPTRVLVVDDDLEVAEVLGRYLHLEGYQVDSCSDGAAALDHALKDPPDLVILDEVANRSDGCCFTVRLPIGGTT